LIKYRAVDKLLDKVFGFVKMIKRKVICGKLL